MGHEQGRELGEGEHSIHALTRSLIRQRLIETPQTHRHHHLA
jgi:hypothetical protein